MPKETIDAVIAKAPDAEWRLIIALTRYGGLRCPSEVLSLEWPHVDWERERMTVFSPKKEYLPRGAYRPFHFPRIASVLCAVLVWSPGKNRFKIC